jgi:hypothetical protein
MDIYKMTKINFGSKLLIVGAALLVSTSVSAGITVYNPVNDQNEEIQSSSSPLSIGGVRTDTTRPPNFDQQQKMQIQKKRQDDSRLRNQNILSNTPTTIVRNENTVEPIYAELTTKDKYGKLVVIVRPAKSYSLSKLAALSRLFNGNGVTTEYYTADISPMQMQRDMIRENRSINSQSEDMPSQHKMNFYAEQIGRMPSPTVDAENMLSKRYNIKDYPAVIYTDPKGRITSYDFSETKSSGKIVEQILSKIEYIKRGIK